MDKVFAVILLFGLLFASSCKVAENTDIKQPAVSKYLPQEVNSDNVNVKKPSNLEPSDEVKNPFLSDGCINNSELLKNRRCPKYVSPVCGCNNVTYDNKCLAENAGVTKYKQGKCNSSSNPGVGIKTAVK